MTVYRRPDPIPLPHARPVHGLPRVARVHATSGQAPARLPVANLSDRFATDLALGLMKGQFLHDGVLWTEPQLCEAFGISRTALREAVKILSAKGIVETRRKRGTVLRNRSEWNLLDPDVIRWLLASEPEATTHALVEALQVLSRAAGSAATNPDRNGSSVYERAASIKQMGNPFLSAVAEVAWKALEHGDSPRQDLEIAPNKAPV